MNNNFIKLALVVGIAGSILGLSNPAAASGFQLIEQSASGMGNAYAGGAAAAEDATTVFFNPAGMTRLQDSQFVVGMHYIMPSSEFSDKGSTQTIPGPTTIPLQGGDGGDGGVSAAVANVYYVQGLNEDWTFGLGINTPFGLSTEWSNSWQGRYQGIKSEVATINVNPSLAYEVDDKLSLGGGIDIQYIDAELTNAIDTGLLVAAPQAADTIGEVTGDDWGFGFNLGLLYEFSETTRIGATYRSKIDNTLEGDAKFKPTNATAAAVLAGLPPGILDNTDATADIELPAILSIGGYHELNSKWAIMADISWTEWSTLDELVIEFDSAQQDSVEDFDWDDTFRYGVGVNYRHSDTLLWRGGIAFDESPVPSAEKRGVRVPDEDRLWLAFGAGFKPARGITIDVGYAHLFVDDADINNTKVNTTTGASYSLVGEFDNSVDILSAQVTWAF